MTLAFLGDGVYELMVRERLVSQGGSRPAGELHRLAVASVRADAQALVYDALAPLLEEDELSVMKRGRNSHPGHTPKNADPIAYRKATGVEALFGYLYLAGHIQRAQALFQKAMEQQTSEG